MSSEVSVGRRVGMYLVLTPFPPSSTSSSFARASSRAAGGSGSSALGLGAFPNQSFVDKLIRPGETTGAAISRYVLVHATLGVLLSLITAPRR